MFPAGRYTIERWLRAPLLALLLVMPARTGWAGGSGPGLEWADWLVDAQVGSRFDSNVNRADAAGEEEWDLSLHPSLRLGRILQLGERTRLSTSADIGGEIYGRAEDLARLEVGGQLALVHKLALGDAPWLRLLARGGHRESREDERSGPTFTLGAMLGKRFSPRLDASLAYDFTRRYGGDGEVAVAGIATDVFDQSVHQIALDAGYLLTEDLLLNAGVTYRRGDFDSNAKGSRFDVLADADIDAVAQDTVFGGWVYRVEGDAWSPHLQLSYALSDRLSLDAGYRFQYGTGDGLRYRNHGASALLLFRY